MLNDIIKILESNDWVNGSDIIHIAKGKYELPITRKEKWKQFKWKWRIYLYRVRLIAKYMRINKKISTNQKNG